MNIFYLDHDPRLAAEMLHDKHVVKMILETAQILSTVCYRHGSWVEGMYRPTHPHHPSVVWAGDSSAHFAWLVDHGQHLCNEYHYRYGKLHRSGAVIDLCGAEIRLSAFPARAWTQPTQAMPDEFKVAGDSVAAYRAYYLGRKVEQSKWTRRPAPTFVLEGSAIMAKSKKKAETAAPAVEFNDESAAPAAAKRQAPGMRGLKNVPLSATITLLVDHNPKRPGCAAEKRFALYQDGMTQEEFLAAGGTTPDLAYDTAHGYIAVEGYTPKPVVPKPRTPKEPKPPKAEAAARKPRRAKAESAAAAPVPAVEEEVVAETID